MKLSAIGLIIIVLALPAPAAMAQFAVSSELAWHAESFLKPKKPSKHAAPSLQGVSALDESASNKYVSIVLRTSRHALTRSDHLIPAAFPLVKRMAQQNSLPALEMLMRKPDSEFYFAGIAAMDLFFDLQETLHGATCVETQSFVLRMQPLKMCLRLTVPLDGLRNATHLP